MMRALDLFSAAAGGWSLGLHRAGFITVAACEIVEWRRILYAENNPHVRIYEDVRSLTAGRLVSDLGFLPDIIVGSPPCQDISNANTKGKGIDGERSGLYLEAVRLVGDCRPRWFAFENSPNLRTRGADRLLDALAALGYACEPCVVGADNFGANHIRKRSWLIGFDPSQLAGARFAIPAGWSPSGEGIGSAEGNEGAGPVRAVPPAADGDAPEVGCRSRRLRRRAEPASGARKPARRHDADSGEAFRRTQAKRRSGAYRSTKERREGTNRHAEPAPPHARDTANADSEPLRLAILRSSSGDQAAVAGNADTVGKSSNADEARQPDGRLESGPRAEEIPVDGRGHERRDEVADTDRDRKPDGAVDAEMGGSESIGGDAAEPWPDWNGGLAHHLRVDDGLSAWVARTRVAIGPGKRTSAASLIVEAFGDAVLPQIPEAIGRAILRTEHALDWTLHIYSIAGDEE